MANRLTMAAIHAIETLHGSGYSNRKIAELLDVHRETVAKYVREAQNRPNAPTGSEAEDGGVAPVATVATIHVVFKGGLAGRRKETRLLDDVYRSVRDAGTEKDVIICGDFNLPPNDKGWDELKAEDEMAFAIGPPAKTTIGGVSLFDNFWWPKASKEVLKNSGAVFEFDRLMYPPGSKKEQNRLTSDHRPISIQVIVDGADDD